LHGQSSFYVIETQLNSSLDQSSVRLVDAAGLVLVVDVAYKALNTVHSQESEPSHDIVHLIGTHVHHLEELLDVEGVEHGAVVGVDFSLIKKTHHLVSVQSRVAVVVEGTLRHAHEVHAQVGHALVVSSIGEAGGIAV